MKFIPTQFEGVRRIVPRIHRDIRGDFVKTYHRSAFQEAGINFVVAEEFFTTSRQDVVRGMHFQLPPAAHNKVVFCIHGSVLDVVVDLRRTSPTFGQAYAEELNEINRNALFIPFGFAHGFLVNTPTAVMYYLTDAVHSPEHDAGIHWNSFGFAWNIHQPIVSQRDQHLPALADFTSPF